MVQSSDEKIRSLKRDAEEQARVILNLNRIIKKHLRIQKASDTETRKLKAEIQELKQSTSDKNGQLKQEISNLKKRTKYYEKRYELKLLVSELEGRERELTRKVRNLEKKEDSLCREISIKEKLQKFRQTVLKVDHDQMVEELKSRLKMTTLQMEEFKKQMDLLEKVFRMKQEEIDNFRKKNKVLVGESRVKLIEATKNKTLQEVDDTTETTIDHLNNTVVEEYVDVCGKNKYTSKSDRKDLENAIEIREKQIDSLINRFSSLNNEATEVVESKDKIIDDLNKQMETLNVNIDLREKQNATMKSDMKSLENIIEKQEHEIDSIQKDHSSDKESKDEQIGTLKSDKENLRDIIVAKDEMIEKLGQDLIHSEENIELRYQHIEHMKNDMANLENVFETREKDINFLEDENKALSEIVDSREKEAGDLKIDNTHLEIVIDTKDTDLEVLKMEIKVLEELVSKLRKQLKRDEASLGMVVESTNEDTISELGIVVELDEKQNILYKRHNSQVVKTAAESERQMKSTQRRKQLQKDLKIRMAEFLKTKIDDVEDFRLSHLHGDPKPKSEEAPRHETRPRETRPREARQREAPQREAPQRGAMARGILETSKINVTGDFEILKQE